MAEQRETQRLLGENLTEVKRVLMAQTAMTPGFKVIVEIANEACIRATQDILKVDPKKPDYNHILEVQALRARYWSEFSDLLFKSIYAHVDAIDSAKQIEQEAEGEDAPPNIHGIYPSAGGTSADAIRKTFGIHTRAPRKKKQSQTESPAEGVK
jgi:hypothetical protein